MRASVQCNPGELCMICGVERDSGIHVCNQLICEACQNEMVNTEVTDEKYKFFLQKMSRLSVTVKKAQEAAGSRGH